MWNKPQLWTGKSPIIRDVINPVVNGHMQVKPHGGLWTSTYKNEQYGSEWIQWCLSEDFMIPVEGYHSTLLYPKKDAKIHVINSVGEMNYVFDNYKWKKYEDIGVKIEFVDFEEMAKDFDGLHLTDYGQYITRHPMFTEFFISSHKENPDEVRKANDSLRTFYGWDCESTLWFNDVFDVVEYIGKFKFVREPYGEEDELFS
jgi:hypothetical protein